MKCLFALFFVLLSNAALFAQIKITGKVASSVNAPIEFAEVILITKDSIAIKSELTNERGAFLFEAKSGWYEIQIRQTNKILFSKALDLNADLDLGLIQVNNINHLESVIVEGKKKLIERKVDRLIFNVENSISATGGDALDALNITPGMKVQNDKISVIGKNTVGVMIDDKLIPLTNEDLANFLRSISSDNIKSIEVITTPPAKYDALGNSGLINIKLKKAKANSWNALLGSAYIQRNTYGDGSVLGNFNYNKNKLSLSASLNFRDGGRYNDQDDYANFSDGLWYTRDPYKLKYQRTNGKFGIDYKATSKWVIGGQYIFSASNSKINDNPYTPVLDYSTNAILKYLKSNGSVQQQSPEIHSINLFNEIQLDTMGKKITLNLDYFSFNNEDVKTYDGFFVIKNPFSNQFFKGLNSNIQKVENFSGRVDFEIPMKWINVSFGARITHSNSKNNISAFNSGLVNAPIPNFQLINSKFEYNEDIQALYLSGNKKMGEQWEAQAGLRMEATQTKTFFENRNQPQNKYIKLFPTAYISYAATKNSTFAINYSRRIDRPRFNDLNPNVCFLSPFQTIEGNPVLQPAFIDNFECTHTYKRLESKIYFSHEENLFAQVPIADPSTKFIRFTNENYINTNRFGISENYVFDKYKFWTSNNAFDLNYAISKSKLSFAQAQKGFNSRISTSNDFILNKKKSWLINLNYWYSFQGINGIYNNGAMSSTSITIQYLLLNKDLKISLRGNDLFRTEKETGNSVVNGIYQNFIYYYDTQSFQLSLNYKFGNKKIKVEKRETGNEAERSRTGN